MELTFDRSGNEDRKIGIIFPIVADPIFFINSKLTLGIIRNNNYNYFDNLLANKEHNFKFSEKKETWQCFNLTFK